MLAAVVTQSVTWFRDKWNERREADFSALYLALALENYAASCAEQIGESEIYEESQGAGGSAQNNVNPLPNYPENINWKAWGIKGTTDALSFRLAVDEARSRVSSEWQNGDDDLAINLIREEVAELGTQAIELAAKFRRYQKLKALKDSARWSPHESLVRKRDKYQRKSADRIRRNSEFNAKLFGELNTGARSENGSSADEA